MNDVMNIFFVVSIGIFAVASLLFLFPTVRKKIVGFINPKAYAKQEDDLLITSNNKQVILAAYERLILLCNRIDLPNLISREALPNLSAREMQLFLINNIKQEYEYNITQQMYVSADSWKAVKTLYEQNIYLINTVAQTMPDTASGTELNRSILTHLANNNKGHLAALVCDVLSAEVKKIL